MKIIWNEEELKNIRKIFLQRTNFRLDKDYRLVEDKNLSNKYSFYNCLTEEIENLLYYQDKTEIIRVLLKAQTVKFDRDDPAHYGLVTTLADANPEDPTYIFEIFKQIASQYEKTASSIVRKKISKCNDIREITELISKFKNNTDITEEEYLVKITMQTIFSYTNGIERHELFKPLVRKYNDMIKERINYYYNNFLTDILIMEKEKKSRDVRNHNADFKKRIANHNHSKSKTTYLSN